MTKTNLLENLINITRYIPFINSFMCVLYSVLEYFSIHIHILNILIGMSFIYIYVLYILSYLLHFCWKHRLAIHFISIYLLTSLIDSYFKLPISDFSYLLLILGIAFIFLLYYFIRSNYERLVNYFYNKLAPKN